MAKLYTRNESISEEPDYKIQQFNLFQLFTLERDAYIMGIKFIQPDSQEAVKYLSSWQDRLEAMEYSEEEVQRKMQLIISGHINIDSVRMHLFVQETGFAGLKLPNRDGCPLDNILTDSSSNIACHIKPEKRLIEIFPYNDDTGDPKWHYYYDAAKAGVWNRFRYDGSLREALAEFTSQGFTLNRMRWPTHVDRVNRTYDVAKEHGVLVKKNISLDEFN